MNNDIPDSVIIHSLQKENNELKSKVKSWDTIKLKYRSKIVEQAEEIAKLKTTINLLEQNQLEENKEFRREEVYKLIKQQNKQLREKLKFKPEKIPLQDRYLMRIKELEEENKYYKETSIVKILVNRIFKKKK